MKRIHHTTLVTAIGLALVVLMQLCSCTSVATQQAAFNAQSTGFAQACQPMHTAQIARQ